MVGVDELEGEENPLTLPRATDRNFRLKRHQALFTLDNTTEIPRAFCRNSTLQNHVRIIIFKIVEDHYQLAPLLLECKITFRTQGLPVGARQMAMVAHFLARCFCSVEWAPTLVTLQGIIEGHIVLRAHTH